MTTPNQMPRNNNQNALKILSALIETQPSGWNRKLWNEEKKEVETVKVSHTSLRYPLAQNVSELNVERASRRLS